MAKALISPMDPVYSYIVRNIVRQRSYSSHDESESCPFPHAGVWLSQHLEFCDFLYNDFIICCLSQQQTWGGGIIYEEELLLSWTPLWSVPAAIFINRWVRRVCTCTILAECGITTAEAFGFKAKLFRISLLLSSKLERFPLKLIVSHNCISGITF